MSIPAQPASGVAGGFSRVNRDGSVLGKPPLLLKQVSPVFLVEYSAGVIRTYYFEFKGGNHTAPVHTEKKHFFYICCVGKSSSFAIV